MSDDEGALIRAALKSLLTETLFRASDRGCWVLNPGEPGFVEQLSELSAAEASTAPAPGRKTIAAHAFHIRFQLSLFNRWADGDPNPFAGADWASSWAIERVSDSEWKELLADLRSRGEKWIAAVETPRTWDEISLTGSMASAAHVAYHLSAVRQMIAWIRSAK